MARRRRPTYSPEFKAEAIRLLRTSADPAKKVARDLGVSVSTLEAWMRATRPPTDPALTTDERESWSSCAGRCSSYARSATS